MLRMGLAGWLLLAHVSLAAAHEPATMTADELKAIIVRLRSDISRLEAENARLKKAVEDNGIVFGAGYHSIVEILRDMPAELQVQKWDEYTIRDAIAWLDKEPIGEPFEATLEMTRVQVSRNPYSSDPAQSWMATLSFKPREFKYQGVVFSQKVVTKFGAVQLFGDEQFAQRMSKLRKQRVQLQGKVQSITIGRAEKNRREVRITLSDLKHSLD